MLQKIKILAFVLFVIPLPVKAASTQTGEAPPQDEDQVACVQIYDGLQKPLTLNPTTGADDGASQTTEAH